jgi:glycerol-3-phosphate O-acyltransferase
VLLLDAPRPTDRRVLYSWLREAREAAPDGAELRVAHGAAEAALLAIRDDASIAPVRVAWLPPGIDGDRRWRKRDLPKLGRRSGLSERERERILAEEPERCRILIGEPARASELRARMRAQTKADSAGRLTQFIDRQARLTLDRAERSVTGSRYKVPRDVKQQLISDRRFENGIVALAAKLGKPVSEIRTQALRCLGEMACTQSPLMRELWARWARLMYARAYELRFDPAAIERLRELGREHPLVFLPTHKSNLDGYVLASLLYEQGFPPNHTLGGINMAFWPLGPVGRRVGVIWIRRAIREDPVYRWVLRQYLSYLVGRRFNLEWYIEGGRTRTGKLLPPKMGLLRYLVDAIEEARIDDVQVVPVSIVYDQLEEVAEMTAECRGAVKPAEGLRWLLDYARRQSRSAGRVHVHFGESIGVTPALRRHGVQDDPRLALAKLAFEICTAINRATPVNRTGMVTLAMLGIDGRSLSAEGVSERVAPLQRYAQARGLPGAEETRGLSTASGTESTLATLVEHGVVTRYGQGSEPVYAIGRENELVAAFYRNGVIHWFVNRAIAELALLKAAEVQSSDDPVEVAWNEAFRLRDVLKFEFFFSDHDRFRTDMREELALIEPSWTSASGSSLREVGRTLADSGALVAHRVLTSFLEAYQIVAECLLTIPLAEPFEADAFMARCLGLGEQLRRQQRITSGEAVSTELFGSALKLADNRGLLGAGNADATTSREAFADELRDLVARVRQVAKVDRTPTAPEPLLAAAVGI